jgi:competence protein ComFC
MHCVICKSTVVSKKNVLCYLCWRDLSFIDKNITQHLNIAAIIDYNSIARKLIHTFKYKSPWLLCDLFINWISLTYPEIIASCDFIIPVPMHKYKLMIRSYNQVAILAQKLAKRHQKKCLLNHLIKIKNTKSQSLLDENLRSSNVIDAFALKRGRVLENKNILLLDDVITTGSTIKECMKTIESNCNTQSIKVLCVAMTKNSTQLYNNICLGL